MAILAIIGEAEGETFRGKVAVAETIRERGSLAGVYGLTAPRVLARKYSQKTYEEARKAWKVSKSTNISKGADGWGNSKDLKKFKKENWFKKNCVVVAKIGNHFFWKNKNA
jgi:hypothetical protein